MSLKPGEDIGLEVHKKIDQLLISVQGTGEANINDQKIPIKEEHLHLLLRALLTISSILEILT